MAFVLTLVAAAGLVAGCGGNKSENETAAPDNAVPTETAPPPPPPPAPKTAMAMIQPLGSNQISGQVTFTQASAGGVDVQVTLQNATGEHGIHVHEGGECGTDGKAAGPHWNPQNEKHGMLGSDPHHMGDLGNISGGNLTMHVPDWTIGDGGPGGRGRPLRGGPRQGRRPQDRPVRELRGPRGLRRDHPGRRHAHGDADGDRHHRHGDDAGVGEHEPAPK
jgi:Cu-Zn family superoxide dismutase